LDKYEDTDENFPQYDHFKFEDTEESSESDKIYYIGKYTVAERSARILKYKAKIFSRRLKCPISKKFSGRSKVATQKLRINGKFVKAIPSI
jgi:hypothetical protein